VWVNIQTSKLPESLPIVQTRPPESPISESDTVFPAPARECPSAQEQPPFLPGVGKTIPGYEFLEELGRGGMGVVYKARQLGLNRLVALKMVLAGAHAGANELARFHIEAEAFARLQHPNIVRIYEIGEHAGCPYFTMEFVEGRSLAGKLDGIPWSSRAAARLIATLAAAIHSAHERGVVHRDLKPANVLLTADGTPRISDFGLAKRLDSQPGVKVPLTCNFDFLGTPSYMAPEQVAGTTGRIGPATDVYGLGAILYELLTGRPPFKTGNAMDTLLCLLDEEPVPPRHLNRRIPPDLEAVCLKCLEKLPGKRYSTAQELAEDLQRFVADEPVVARKLGPFGRLRRWTSHRPALAATVFAVSVFYTNHLLLLVLRDSGESGFFNWYVTCLMLLWVGGAAIFQAAVHCPRWQRLAVFGWAGMDVLFFTAFLWAKDGPSGPLTVGYLILIALAALRFQVSLVWFVTELCLLSYAAMVVDAYRRHTEQAPTSPQTPVVFALSMLLMGFVMSLLLRRVRAVARSE
jgi:serine/threonine protein kinase